MEQADKTSHIEIDEYILPQADEEYKNIKKVIVCEVNSKDFIESQHQSKDLAPLHSEAQNKNSSKPNYFKINENGLLVKKQIEKMKMKQNKLLYQKNIESNQVIMS
ncbi:hypothetical protein AVEN_203656-1 [Araneus ventricosus]|uniref:Uncharacterized protein n=1 Tax=Araneus ventricosus TaxID=182803 RepID=A0A4Y2EZE3_ARAVE|nr:hypothetical protein AVEN_203656-1 [Araneus ventricosus]